MLEARRVTLSLGGSEVLKGASLSVSPAEIVAIEGPSGSGKSSLLFCLAGLMAPDHGEVRFRERRIDTLKEKDRSALRLREFGFVFQFADLVPELTVAENVELPLRFTGVTAGAARQKALEILDVLGIAATAGRRAFEVSGGQMQRAAVARALVHDPAVVFADEPTGALDEVTGHLVLDLLLKAAGERDTAVVMVTHDPQVAVRAHRRMCLHDGRVQAQVAE